MHVHAKLSMPLNLFALAYGYEHGQVPYLHYGLHAHPGDTPTRAQQRSTELLLSRLPPPPARILEVGIGFGTTAEILEHCGYGYLGLTPDPVQIELAAASGRVLLQARLEDLAADCGPFDVVLCQESAQYLHPEVLLEQSHRLLRSDGMLIVLDEVDARVDQGIPRALRRAGFDLVERLDLTERALPALALLPDLLHRHRQRLHLDSALPLERIDGVIRVLARNLEQHRSGAKRYLLLRARKHGRGPPPRILGAQD